MSLVIVVTHKPSGATSQFGPWPETDDPVTDAVHGTWYNGFAHGWHAAMSPEGSPDDLEFVVQEIPEDGTTEVGIRTYASGVVNRSEEDPT
jgi:hypothetical protein